MLMLLLAMEAEHFKVDVKHQLSLRVTVVESRFLEGVWLHLIEINKYFTTLPYVIIAEVF